LALAPVRRKRPYPILNLHGILANNLLAEERAAGRLRHIGIDGSVLTDR